jgi:hypothetical protein
MPAKGITVYLPDDIETDVLRAAKTKKLSASGIIAYAVKQHFSLHPDGVPEGAGRQLARIEARMDKIVRDNAMIREAVLLFVRVWLEYTPPLRADEEDAAAALAEVRFERFLDLVRDTLDSGGGTAPLN